ncbi:MAG: hypothetical protein MZV70_56915 [Desulfobacterales bacterium]|nr:hypothetical protein [Desulfobacterales bacterium]
MEIAREHKLGHGDHRRHPVSTTAPSLIRYFYEKAAPAQGRGRRSRRRISATRDPSPSTREAALVMLADVVEAASRTLENPTPARIKGLVQNLIDRMLVRRPARRVRHHPEGPQHDRRQLQHHPERDPPPPHRVSRPAPGRR